MKRIEMNVKLHRLKIDGEIKERGKKHTRVDEKKRKYHVYAMHGVVQCSALHCGVYVCVHSELVYLSVYLHSNHFISCARV